MAPAESSRVCAVDELQLPLHAQAGALGGLEGDLHVGSLGSITVPHPPAEHDHPAGGRGRSRQVAAGGLPRPVGEDSAATRRA